MTHTPPVSVIVVSHGRPALLRRVLIGISHLFYRPFEVVVVADADGLAAIAGLPFADRIKTAVQLSPNISAARNVGADLAAGDILAFIDDDAVPEPTWLFHLVSPLIETDFATSTGTVLGRNGISVQWANRSVDVLGQAHPMAGQTPAPGHAIKLEGTNMAIRRSVLREVGGFDEGFGFYLDETDLAFRLFKAGYKTAFAPLATVHHGYAASARRSEDRVPLGLFQIGCSTMLYLRKHGTEAERIQGLVLMQAEQTARLARLKAAGRLDAVKTVRLLADLEAGQEAGRLLPSDFHRIIADGSGFTPLTQNDPPEPMLISGRWTSQRRLQAQATAAAQQGRSVTLMIFDHSIRAHKTTFTQEGIWLQRGGLFGPSDRDQRRFTLWSFNGRVRAETTRLQKIRWIQTLPMGHIRTVP